MQGLKRVSIRGEAYDIIIDVYALTLISKQYKIKIGEIFEKLAKAENILECTHEDLVFAHDVIHAAFINGVGASGSEFPYSSDDLMKIPGLLQSALTALSEDINTELAETIQKKGQTTIKKKQRVKK